MQTVLITGATGFIGRHLIEYLSSNGISVRLAVRKVNLAIDCPQVVISGSPAVCETWKPLVRGCDYVIHLLARAHITKDSSEDPLKAFKEVNTDITQACAEASAQEQVRRFIFLSSIGVHGNDSHNRPFRYDDSPAPYSPYTISKLEAEKSLISICNSSVMEYCIIRPPLVYGVNAPGNMKSLINILNMRLPLPFACVTKNRRSFVAVENLVDLIKLCLVHPNASGKIFLVSDGEDISTADLLKTLSGFMGRKNLLFPVPVKLLKIIFRLLKLQEMEKRLLGNLQIDIEYTKSTLEWSPQTSLNAGLQRMLQKRN